MLHVVACLPFGLNAPNTGIVNEIHGWGGPIRAHFWVLSEIEVAGFCSHVDGDDVERKYMRPQ